MIMGIDPGDKGALFVMVEGKRYFSTTYPKLPSGEIDRYKLASMMNKINAKGELTVLVENVHSVFGASAKANFNFGRNVEIVSTILAVLKIRHFYINPKDWQKIAWQGIKPVYKPSKDNRKRVDTKKTSDLAARKIFPNESFLATNRSKVRHDGLIDAALIAWYGHLKGY
jgi:maltooligosyltrehalose synthase